MNVKNKTVKRMKYGMIGIVNVSVQLKTVQETTTGIQVNVTANVTNIPVQETISTLIGTNFI